MPILGSFLLLALDFREALGSRESIHTFGRHHRCSALESHRQPYAPSDNRKSYRPRVSDRTMVATYTCNRFALLHFRNRIEWEFFLSLPGDCLRTVLAVKSSLRRAQTARP